MAAEAGDNPGWSPGRSGGGNSGRRAGRRQRGRSYGEKGTAKFRGGGRIFFINFERNIMAGGGEQGTRARGDSQP